MKAKRILKILLVWTTVSEAQNNPAATPSSGAITALKNVSIIDGSGAPVQRNQTLIIEGAKLRALGPSATVIIPEGTRVLDLSGRTVLPGLVMLHEHVHYGSEHAEPLSYPRLFLAFGVTTIRTAGTDHPYFDLNLRQKIAEGTIPGPEVHVTSQFLNGKGSRFLGDKVIRDEEDARRTVRYWAAEGVTSFKVYRHISKSALAAIIDEEHRPKLPVTGHLESATCREAAELGIDNIEHGFGSCWGEMKGNVASQGQALIRKLVDSGVVLTITPADFNHALSTRERELLHPGMLEKYQQEKPHPAPSPQTVSSINVLTVAFAKAGGRLVLGSDPGCCGHGRIPGFTNHEAFILLVKGGFTPLEAIRIATIDGATFLGIQDRTGSIAPGKEADLLVVRGDPSQVIEDISNVDIVFANGVAYNPQTLLSAVKGSVGWQ